MKKRKLTSKIITTVVIGAVSLIFVLPLIWMISASLKPNYEIFNYPIRWIPNPPMVQNYITVWTDDTMPFGLMYLNSLKIAFFTIIGKLIISAGAAYAFSKMRFPGKNFIFILFLASMMIPTQVTILPRFVLFKELGLYNTHSSLILPALFDVSAIFLLRQFYGAVPIDLSESAVIDGASHFRIWAQIIVPLTKAPMASLAILALVTSWNDYFNPLIFIVSKNKYTVSLGINNYTADVYVNMGLAASISAILPILLLYIFCQKYFEQSIASSGIKG